MFWKIKQVPDSKNVTEETETYKEKTNKYQSCNYEICTLKHNLGRPQNCQDIIVKSQKNSLKNAQF